MGMAGILFGILFLSLFIGVPIGNLPWSCCFSDNDAHQQRTVSGIYSDQNVYTAGQLYTDGCTVLHPGW